MSLKPISRIENFLARIAGRKDVEKLAPIFRKEFFLDDIAEQNEKDRDRLRNNNFIIELDISSSPVKLDKTNEEIVEAFKNGMQIFAHSAWYLPLSSITIDSSGVLTDCSFVYVEYADGEMSNWIQLTFYDGAWSFAEM